MITRRQHDLLMFIHERLKETGVPPSFDEMREALDLQSKSGIHRLILSLEERGFLRRLPHRARALEVIKLPDSASAQWARPMKGQFQPAVVEGGLSKKDIKPTVPAAPAPEQDVMVLPIMGRIAAGVPIAAIQTHGNDLPVPKAMLGSGEHYALEVRGDSMIEAGILDGDTVIIRKQNTANTGEIIVALILDDEEATLKRLRRRGNSIALEAANPAYETRIFGPEKVAIQGKMVGLIRKYH